MNSDPLQRRMFAQQIMAQHARANQPMGILASSPQLMGAVQGFKDGGAVKGYEAGGASFLDKLISGMGLTKEAKDKNNQTALEQYQKGATNRFNIGAKKAAQFNAMELPGSMYSAKISGILAAHPEVTFDEDKKMFVPKETSTQENVDPSAINTTGIPTNVEDSAITIDEVQKKKIDEKNRKTDDDSSITSDVSQGSTMAEKINEVNAEGNNLEKKEAPKETKKKDETLGNVHSELKGLIGKQDALLEQINNSEKAPKINNDFAKRIKQMETLLKKKGEEVSIEDVDKEARKLAGIDETNYDEDKHTAFWMSLIKGGLATAAGESSNAMTNIAKGLGFGVKSYGEDLATINKQERDDRKELANIRMKLLSEKKSEALAYKTMELQYQSALMNAEQNQSQFESNMAFQQNQANIKNQMAANMFDLSVASTRADLKFKEATMELNEKKLDQSVEQFKTNLNFQISTMKTPKIALEVLGLGANYATFDKEAVAKGEVGVTLTPLGEKLARTLLSGKYKGSTDKLTRSINLASEQKKWQGKLFKTSEDAEAAVISWYSGWADKFGKAKESVIGDVDPIQAGQNVIDAWTKTLTGVVSKEQGNDGDTKGSSTGFKSNTLTVSN